MDMVPLKESSIISFAPGNCGSFLQWCLNFISDVEFPEQLPFEHHGSSHGYFIPRINSFVIPTKEEITGVLDDERYNQKTFTQYTEYWSKNQRSSNSSNLFKEGNFEEFIKLNSLGPRITSVHPISEEDDNIIEILTKISENFRNIIHIVPTVNKSFLYALMNAQSKISIGAVVPGTKKEIADSPIDITTLLYEVDKEKYYSTYLSKGFKDNMNQWPTNDEGELDPWALREFYSFYIYLAWYDQNRLDDVKAIQDIDNVHVIHTEDFLSWETFLTMLIDVKQHCGLLTPRLGKMEEIWNKWIVLQEHKNKDQIVVEIINNILADRNFDWADKNLTIYDEAMIQYYLREKNIEIKCNELNVFPTNTNDLKELLYNV